LALGLAGVLTIRQMRAADAGYKPTFSSIPDRIGEYTLHELELDPTVVNFLRPEAMREIEYSSETANPPWVDISIIYGKDWRPIHSPLHCLSTQGWSIGSQEEITIDLPGDVPHPGPLVAKRLRVGKEGAEMVVLYVLAYPGGTTSSWPKFAYKVATGRGGAGGVILMSRALVTAGERAVADAAAADTLARVYPGCVDFWYSRQAADR